MLKNIARIKGRLPTGKEWEYAAHGGKNFAYTNGDELLKNEANFGKRYRVPVKSYDPNGYGLYDMAGNVAEMVQGGGVKGGDFISSKSELKIGTPSKLAQKNDHDGFRRVIDIAK
jgi:hypothetical protein